MCIYKTEDGKCKKFSDDTVTSWCVDSPCEYEIQTNYDRIRNMSVEEMAKGIQEMLTAHLNKYGEALGYDIVFLSAEEKQDTINKWKEWLESEVDGE